MRGLLSVRHLSLDRVLLIESGPRELTEKALSTLYTRAPSRLDLLTCYDRPPKSFDPDRGTVYSVHAAEAVAHRRRFAEKLARHPYTAVAVLAAGSPVLAKWKWLIVLRTRASVVVLDKNAELLPFSVARAKAVADIFVQSFSRAAVTGFQLLLAPFAIAYLVLFTLAIHLRRWLRLHSRLAS